MAEIKQLKCPACGASLNIPADATRGVCAYCGNGFVVEIDQGEAVLRSSQQITGAIEAGTEQTLTELQRMQLVQQHGDLSQQYTSLRIHQDTIESELRTLQRSKQSRLIRTQIQELEIRRSEIRQQVQEMQDELRSIDAILNPNAVEEVDISVPPPRRSRNLRSGCLWVFGLAIVLALLGSRINRAVLNTTDTPNRTTVGPMNFSPPLDEVITPIIIPEPPTVGGQESEPPTAAIQESDLSTAVPVESEPTVEPTATATVTTNANVRNLPTTRESQILGQVSEGETLSVRMRNADSSWLGISSASGLQGWVSASLLTFNPSEIDALPVGSGTDAVGP
jgi:hypothetical protein